MDLAVENIWLIPALPLMAAGFIAVTRREARRTAIALAVGAMGLSFILSSFALGALISSEPGTGFYTNFPWFDVGAGTVDLGFLLDPMAALMLVMVTFVGLLIFIFSIGYMEHDANATRFFCFLSLFAAAMLGLIIANSLLLLFICWELVGLASYLLIGFWFHKPAAALAARKAFITTRIGDLGLLLGMIWLYDATGTLLFYDGGAGVLETGPLAALLMSPGLGVIPAATAIGLLIFCGAVGKSGQFPLHVWLPDAMEGPTPVSALIHAATMVAAGVFLAARVVPLLSLDLGIPDVPFHALTVVAWTGAITALLGAVLAVAQSDIKRVLAYSTVSQLGYMMLAVGVGGWVAAIFHLLTHAFFKSLLFLGAGSVIHAAHHEQDLRALGGLREKMRATFVTFAIGMMALAGVPFLFSGFWSKEAILHEAAEWQSSQIPLYIGLFGALLTAFYMTRLVAGVFYGKPRSEAAEHAHENRGVMTVPLILLAIGSVLLGFLGTPAWPWLQSFLTGTTPHWEPSHILAEGGALMFGAILIVGVGIGLGYVLYGRRTRANATDPDPIESAQPTLWRALVARLGFDEFYNATVLRLHSALGALSDWLDRHVWDGAVRGVASLGEMTGVASQQTDEEVVNAGFDAGCDSLRGTGRSYSRNQSGQPQSYIRGIAMALVVLALILVLGGAK
ncbi:MAG TPA: NADH-quinone oxidoreductase subunit L [Opitutaceae bacterium]|nr:NADH-quinone oxidoreductase subunit L [Opitutaceae bacterium]